MNNSEAGCLSVLMIVIYASAWIGTGTLAWDWIEPDSFWGGVKFIIVWGIFGYIAQLIGGLILAGIGSIMND